MSDTLGYLLQGVRKTRGWSLREAAERVGISPAYLQKLEQEQVQNPSPHILNRLAEKLQISYSDLMELAGYVVPSGSNDRTVSPSINPLAFALPSAEAEALTRRAGITAVKNEAFEWADQERLRLEAENVDLRSKLEGL